jgi:hypothetical protein
MTRSIPLIALLALLLAPATARAGTFGAAETIGTGGSAFGPQPEIGFDNTGGVVVMYEGSGVRAAIKPNLGTFSDTLLGPGSRASLAVARNGAAVIAWRASATAVQVAYRPSPGVAFTANQQTFAATAAGNVAAGIDSNGNAVVAWKDGGIRFATSTGPAFGAPQNATALGADPGFEGRGGDTQRDMGPRAFRDDDGNIVLVYRDGQTVKVAHNISGQWSTVPLPGSATDVKADADPTSRKLIVGYTSDLGFSAYTGLTSAPGVSNVVTDAAAPGGGNAAVAVRENDREDVAVWQAGGLLRAAGCADAYQVLDAAPTGSYSSAAAALTTGSDQVAGVTGVLPQNFFSIGNSRPPSGTWGTPAGLSTMNSGGIGGAAGFFGEALFAVVNTDGTVRGFTYTGTPNNNGGKCGSVQPVPSPTPSATPTGTPSDAATSTMVICTYRYATEDDLCTATVGAAVARMPTGDVTFTDTRGGAFPQGNRCTLQPTTGSANVASCSLRYLRPYEVPPARSFPNVSATYVGAPGFRPSVGTTRLLGCIVGGKMRAAGPTAPPATVAAVGGPFTIKQKQKLSQPTVICPSSVPSFAIFAGAKAAPRKTVAAPALISATAAEWSAWLQFNTNIVDPVDNRFREIVKPRAVKLPRFAKGRKASATDRAYDAFLANEAASYALQQAQLTSIYRAQTAFNAGVKKWAKRQMLAVASFTKRIADLRAKHGKLAKRLVAALRKNGDVKLTPKSAEKAQERLDDGFPAPVRKAVQRIVGAKGVKDLLAQAARVDPSTADTTLSALIARSAAQDAQVAGILRKGAARMRKNPSQVPGV